jgi:prepilin-type N-terminal cleavage/methylation domain-containing protein
MYTFIMLTAPAHSKLGFTLVELLLVIALMAILAGFVIMVINPATYMARARDSRRISDIRALASSITYALSGNYIILPDTTSGCLSCTSITGSKDTDGVNGWVKFTSISSEGVLDFMATLPEDPINNSTYYFEYASDGKKFELNAKLEDPQHSIKLTNEGGTDMTKYEVGTSLILIP